MIGFAHPETRRFNQHIVTPRVVAKFVRDAGREALALEPGEGWDSEAGFLRNETSLYDDLDAELDALTRRVAPKVEKTMETERGVRAEYAAFERHLGGFVRSLPIGTRRLLPRSIVFFVPSDVDTPYWCIHANQRRIARVAEPPDDWATLITVPEAVLADAIEKNILNFVHISMRVRIRIAAGGVSTDLAFWGLLLVWEMGYFDGSRMLTPRAARVFWRRRAEILQTVLQGVRALASGKKVAEGMVDNLLVREEGK